MSTETESVTVSERAARRDRRDPQAGAAGHDAAVSVEGGGCSGFQYKFDMERTQAEDDILIRRDSAAVLIDAVSPQLPRGSEIDFVDDLIGASFRINNPQAKASAAAAPASRSRFHSTFILALRTNSA